MSSNIEIQKICQLCGKQFTAKKTVTKYCSPLCTKRAYKKRMRDAKIENANKETQKILNKPIEQLKEKEFLTVREVSVLLNCSVRSVYYSIEAGSIKAINLGQRITRIKRSEIDILFSQQNQKEGFKDLKNKDNADMLIIQQNPVTPHQNGYFDTLEYYSLAEVLEKYKLSYSSLNTLLKTNEIPKIKNGWFTYVSKNQIDKILNINYNL
jgi:excisionase family DNA binding protein